MNQVKLTKVLDELDTANGILNRYTMGMYHARLLQNQGVIPEEDAKEFCQIVGRVVLGAWKAENKVTELTALRDSHPDYEHPADPENKGENNSNSGDKD